MKDLKNYFELLEKAQKMGDDEYWKNVAKATRYNICKIVGCDVIEFLKDNPKIAKLPVRYKRFRDAVNNIIPKDVYISYSPYDIMIKYYYATTVAYIANVGADGVISSFPPIDYLECEEIEIKVRKFMEFNDYINSKVNEINKEAREYRYNNSGLDINWKPANTIWLN